MKTYTPSQAPTKSVRSLKRAAFVALPLLAYLSLAACSSSEVGSPTEELGQSSAALQLSGTATASSVNGGAVAANAVDGNAGSRWESLHGVDPQWLMIDLGSQKTFDRVYLSWETAYAKGYTIQQSNDNVNWTTIYTQANGDGGIDDITGLTGNARYVRMHGTVRGSAYGYSLYEMQVHQTATSCLSNDLMTSATLPMTGSSGTAALAADNNAGTRWESAASDPQWLQVDLGTKQKINRVNIQWETASAKDYTVQLSDNGTTWTTLVTKTNMPAGVNRVDDLTGLNGAGRYVRVNGTARTTAYGYSIFELSVYGDPNPSCGGSSCTPSTCAALGASCGSVSDGCGGTLSCGTCSGGQTCNASNQCVASGSSCLSNDQTTSTTLATTQSTGTAASAIDNNVGTRWQSSAVDPSWMRIDLGSKKKVNRVRIDWETANAKDYRIELSDDGTTWSTLVTKTAMPAFGNHRIDDLTGLNGAGRYVRMYGTARNTGYGYSIYEMDVYGDPNPNCGGGGSCTPSCSGKSCGGDGCGGVCGTCGLGLNCDAAQQCVTGTAAYYNTGKTLDTSVDFGPNVKVYNPSTPAATIQSELNAIFTAQEKNQFGPRRDAVLFTPGTYGPDVNIGFYTHIAGAGDVPDAVNLTNWVHVDATWFVDDQGNHTYNATQNFWRSIENLYSSYTGQNMRWAVSQAAPFRRMHTAKAIDLHHNNGWCSGGFMADSKMDDWILSSSQQQWYTRNSHVTNWNGSNWNMVFQGDTGNPPAQSFPNPPMTNIANSPVIREKPFLYVDRDGKWNVFVPAVRTNAVGPSWTSGPQAGSPIPLSSFYIAKAATDTAATMNAALSQGKHLLITPGIYHLNAPLAINNANTVVLGIGMATLVPDNGVKAMTVADVDGVKLAGLLFDAGTGNSPVLLEVGPTGSSASHSANPTSLHDLVFRVGGGTWIGKAVVSLQVNSNDVIGDHFWVWRADHSDTPNVVAWNLNTAQNGVVVNGNNVTFYGLFVEHFQQYQVIWNGNNGKTFFYQSELPYDAPTQASWMNGTGKGYASYKVANNVVNHEAHGLGIYAVFTMNPGMVSDRGIEAPDAQPGVKFRGMVTLSITANGLISNVINNTGGVANALDFSTYPRLAAWH